MTEVCAAGKFRRCVSTMIVKNKSVLVRGGASNRS
jgi:hypothetical protein